MKRLLDIRDGDARPAAVGFLVLAGITAGHSMLETARDTLFLSRLPATALPWAYLGIAAIVLVLARLTRRTHRRRDRRRSTAVLTAAAAIGSAGFWLLAGTGLALMPVALYLWTGVVATVLLPRFWIVLGDVVTAGQARRLYTLIGAGALVGAAGGAGLAGLLLGFMSPRGLLLGGAALLVLPAVGMSFFGRPIEDHGAGETRRSRPAEGAAARLLTTQTYLRRLLLVSLATTMTVTVVDYLFKSAVAGTVPANELGHFFARTYATLNAIALVVQLLVAPWLLARFGVGAALLVLPISLLAGGAGFVAAGVLLPILLAKVADGAFRNSLNRVGAELLILPLPAALRERAKPILEAVGTRGGQALASLLILGALALGARSVHLAVALVGLAFLWLLSVIGLRGRYLDIYRGALREGRLRHDALSAPDPRALETLVAALSSASDEEVVAAMDLLQNAGKTALIPTPMVYHPSTPVVRRALEIFSQDGRPLVRAVERLRGHSDPLIRALGLLPNAAEPELAAALADPAAIVRATAVVALLRSGDDPRTTALVERLGQDAEGKAALARAVHDQPDPALIPILVALAQDERPEVVREVARAARALPSIELLPRLIAMLADPDARRDVRAAILAIGHPALAPLERALVDRGTPRAVRRHLPRTIGPFGSPAAVAILVRQLGDEHDGAVRFKILRALGRLRTNDPALPFDEKPLRAFAKDAVARAVKILGWRVSLARGDTPAGPALDLLRVLLAEKERHAIERVFRALGLLQPRDELEVLYAGTRSDDRRRREAASEVLAGILKLDLKDEVLALVDDLPDDERLKRVGGAELPLDETFTAMGADHSVALHALVEHLTMTRSSERAS